MYMALLGETETSPGRRRVESVRPVANWRVIDPQTQEESEQLGREYLARRHQVAPERFVQTSYNAAENGFRKNFAGEGYEFDSELNAFIPPKPANRASWVLDEETCQWMAPVDPPATVGIEVATWNEETGAWDVSAIISKNDFDDRFLQDEWNAVEESDIPEVKRLRAKAFWLSAHINLLDQRVIAGVNALEHVFKRADETTPIIGEGRAAEILSTEA